MSVNVQWSDNSDSKPDCNGTLYDAHSGDLYYGTIVKFSLSTSGLFALGEIWFHIIASDGIELSPKLPDTSLYNYYHYKRSNQISCFGGNIDGYI